MKLNLSIRGGASKGQVYLRFLKELDAKGGMTSGRITGCSAGGITAAGIACQYRFKDFYKFYDDMPGKKVMEWEKKVEKGNFFEKLLYTPLTLIATREKLTQQLKSHFEKIFYWSKVPAGIELNIGFCLLSELGKVGASDHFTYLDMIKILKSKDAKNISKDVNIYFGCREGVKMFDKKTKVLKLVSNTQIPLHLLVFASMWNPVFKKIPIVFREDNPFDGGIANNHANCAQIVGEPFIQLVCESEKDDAPTGNLSDYYKSMGPAPEKTVYLDPIEKNMAFFQFTDRDLKRESAGPATTCLG